MSYEIGECQISDIRAIIPVLRQDDLAELRAADIAPRHVLYNLWRQSFTRRAVWIDGAIAAVFGCTGTLAGGDGYLWLFTSPIIEKLPLAFFREARAQIRDFLETKTILETGVLRSYERSIRFWKMVGFAAAEQYEVGGVAFLKLRLERS